MKLAERYSFLRNPFFILWTYIIIILIASVHRYWLGVDHVHNYIVFKNSFINLIDNKDIYLSVPKYNEYKYSPTFAFLMAPFAIVPDLIGLIIWNLLNVLVLFYAVKMFPIIDDRKKIFILWFVLLELLTSVQNSQSNGLIAGLLLLAFVSFEKKNVLLAALFISLSFYIKIFGAVAALLFLLYPDKIKFIFYMALWTLLLFFIPLLVIPFKQLIFLYQSWLDLLANDKSHSLNFSVMTLVRSWFGITIQDIYFQLTGLLLLLFPFINYRRYKLPEFRTLLLSSILIWIVIFNHKAESPTFVIAILGAALWFITADVSKWNIALIIFAFVLTSLSPTDLFPKFIRDQFVVPYVLKVLPCILIWMKIQYQLTFNNPPFIQKEILIRK